MSNKRKELAPLLLFPQRFCIFLLKRLEFKIRVIKLAFIVVDFITNHLAMDVEAIQIKKFPFGAATVTSLGMLGVRDCWSPNNCKFLIETHLLKFFAVILRGKMIVSVNEIEKRAVCVDGKIEIRPMVYLNFTVDHRFMDGGRAKKIYEIVI